MHKDTKEALERLERELLASEKPQLNDDDLDLLIESVLFDDEPEDFSDPLPAENTQEEQPDWGGYYDAAEEEPEQGSGELWFAIVMLVLIAVTMIVWAVRLL